MKIVMDFRKYDGVIGGVEQVVIQITKGVIAKGHFVVLLCKKRSLKNVEELFSNDSNLKIIPLDVDNHSISEENELIDSTVIQDIAEQEDAGVIHFPYNWSFPSNKKAATILTIHDVIPFTFREAMDEHTNKHLYKPGIKRACELNDIVVTISNFSKKDISEKVGVPIEKIRVIPNGLRRPLTPSQTLIDDLKTRFELENGFILNVGGIHERKNIVRLIHAFKVFVDKSEYKGKLLITGSVSNAPYQDEMKKLCDKAVSETELEDKIVFTGFISDDKLDALYSITDFLIYPSLYEGFGIPLLEAMYSRAPIVTSNVTAMPEITEDAAIHTDPYSVEDMAASMFKLYSNKDLQEKLIEKGLKIVETYSWERTVDEYIAVYEEVYKKYADTK